MKVASTVLDRRCGVVTHPSTLPKLSKSEYKASMVNFNLRIVACMSVMGSIALGIVIGWVGRDTLNAEALAQQQTETGAA